MLPRFTIKKLLLCVAISCAGFAILTQLGFRNAEFQISENELFINDDDLVSGALWGFMGEQVPSANQWSFVCEIRNVDRPSLLGLKAGSKTRIRYRYYSIGRMKKEDGFRKYLIHTLGFRSDQIKGFVRTSQGTKVVIDGTSAPPAGNIPSHRNSQNERSAAFNSNQKAHE